MPENQLPSVGRYQLLELLDRGGMGDVYRAQHRKLDIVVALTLIRPELSGSHQYRN